MNFPLVTNQYENPVILLIFLVHAYPIHQILYHHQEFHKELEEYLEKITDEALYAYNVYQIEGEGRSLFSKIEGDENTIMGLPINKIKEYIDSK